MREFSPLVSIVIPTLNSARFLDKCLQSIKAQTYPNIEIIVVDGGSTDETVSIAKKYGVNVIEGCFNKPSARNIGILKSKGEYVILADADYIFEQLLVEEIVKCFVEERCDAIVIPEEYLGKDFMTKCKNIEKKIYEGVDVIESPRAYRKRIFDKVLFDEKNEGPDEYDFYLNAAKFGLKVCRVKSKFFLSEPAFRPLKKFKHGKFFVYYKNKHKNEVFVKRQLSFSHRLKLLSNAFKYSKTKALMLLLLKSVEFVTFRLGMLSGSLDPKIQRLTIDAKAEFEKDALFYEKKMYYGTLGNQFVDFIERESVLSIIKSIFDGRKIKVLEIGSGGGRWVKEFTKAGFEVTAQDVSEVACKSLVERFEGLHVICGDVERIKLPYKYDLVFAFRSFKYVNNRKQALRNIVSVLEDNGYLIVEMPNKFNPFYLIGSLTVPLIYLLSGEKMGRYFILANLVSEGAFKRELMMHGFDVIRVEKIFTFPHFLYSKINHKPILRAVYTADKFLRKLFPRSLLFIARKRGK
ncbi:MAG: glycosyltransferase [Candidatus Bathyarchaeia archaeon]